jgi:uncharacterized cupredoxin-like copper-binding protein
MYSFRRILAAAALLAAMSPAAHAGDLVTPPIWVGQFTNAACRLVNISSSTITAHFQLVDGTGTVLFDSGSFTVSAGETVANVVADPGGNVYCRFVNASKSKVRGSLTAYVGSDDGTDHTVVAAQ